MGIRCFRLKFRVNIFSVGLVLIVFSIVSLVFLQWRILYWSMSSKYSILPSSTTTTETLPSKLVQKESVSIETINMHELRAKLMNDRINRLSQNVRQEDFVPSIINKTDLNYNVHAFYYAWYKNITHDGHWAHWNHKYLLNWKKKDTKIYPTGSHSPPLDIGANFYPELGCYSSKDINILHKHMRYFIMAGIGVLVISWAPPGYIDSPTDMMQLLLDTANSYGIKVALQIEPYENRNPIDFRGKWEAFLNLYGNHKALYRIRKGTSSLELPVVYIYDSYLSPASTWKEIMSPGSDMSVRNTNLDGIFIGLLVDAQHKAHIRHSHFDGFYTYFAANGFSFGSTWKNWKSLAKFAVQNRMIFIPSVGPGYIDTEVRPWNGESTRQRGSGRYYRVAWNSALTSGAEFVSVTSFNEWHEGTQIEPAVSKPGYMDYKPEGPLQYLAITRQYISKK